MTISKKYSFAVFSLLVFSGAFSIFFDSVGNFLFYVFTLFIYVTSFLSVSLNRFWQYLRNETSFLVLVGLVMLSLFWSVNIGVTATRSIAFLGTVLFAFYFYSKFALQEVLRCILIVAGISLLLSFIAGLFFPELGIHQKGPHTGLWKGVFAHKNILSRMASIWIITSLSYSIFYAKKRLLSLLILVLSGLLLILAGGKTGVLVLFFTLVLFLPSMYIYIYVKKNWALYVFVTILAFSAILVIYVLFVDLLSSIGGDVTLTGRTVLWVALLELIVQESQTLFLGFGFGAFWDSAYVFEVNSALGPFWEIKKGSSHAHNGFIELVLDLGLVGLTFFVIKYTQLIRDYLRLALMKKYEFFAVIMMLISFILFSVTGNSILSQNSVELVLFIYFMYTIKN